MPFRTIMMGAIVAVTSFLGGLQPCAAQGYQVQPMIATMTPSGSGAATRISVRNTGSVPVTLEFEPFRVSVDLQGTPTRSAEENDLLVFPPQTVVQPGAEQAVQVRYVGDASLTEARMYGVRISQVPINFGGGVSNSGASADVRMSFNFLTHLIISPESAKSAVEVAEVGRSNTGEVTLTLLNSGNGVAVLNNVKWRITDAAGQAVELATEKVDVGNFSALMPKQQRRVRIPPSETAQLAGPVQVALVAP
ncbi:fimbria/pilus periplasmic chaperone [Sphingomonas sp. S2-65]|uniref:fimbria/pilus periplasmic chaperone n=1 Tax=Sphingomonas sp. S2-65 TaxID=2903960 RepID=UPI001F1AFC5D|nr:fimbria/pilus periplasmic chaperone [Sphingomonas sp. S2-65]UYY57088.1 fimbria/pilus periplasmic chaperone [Sphingomonas sp. S2-65]